MRYGGKLFVAFGALLALNGCGGGGNTGASQRSVTIPPDATYNESIRFGRYVITDLGPGEATAINNKGQVVGNGGASSPVAYIWQNGVQHYLGILPDDDSSNAVAINDTGQVAGNSIHNNYNAQGDYTTTSHAFYWDNGGLQAISSNSLPTEAVSINNSGVVVGGQGFLGASGNFQWQNGQYLVVASPLQDPANRVSEVAKINNAGQVAGSRVAYSEAYVITNGVRTSIGTYPGGQYVLVGAFNDAGQIAGSSYVTDHILTFLWQNGTYTRISDDMRVYNMNNKGRIVGQTQNYKTALYYDGATVMDLNTVVGSGSGWQFVSANGINDVGQIVGMGQYKGEYRSFLLTPQ